MSLIQILVRNVVVTECRWSFAVFEFMYEIRLRQYTSAATMAAEMRDLDPISSDFV
eukprot:SAG11_NODE_421_length_9620_cov_10.014809_7_plen_56_part_00